VTRKHLKLIADIIKNCRDIDESARANLAREFASVLATTNPNFNRSRFIDACTGGE
jgi:hypothetical protein